METNDQRRILKEFMYHLAAMLCVVPLAPMINRVMPPLIVGS
jgi:hypothetical protein